MNLDDDNMAPRNMAPHNMDRLGPLLRDTADREMDGVQLTMPSDAPVIPLESARRARALRRQPLAAAAAIVLLIAGGWWITRQPDEPIDDGPATAPSSTDPIPQIRAAVEATTSQPWQGTLTLPNTPVDTIRSTGTASETESADGTVQRFVDNKLWEGTRNPDDTIDWATSSDSIDPFARLFRSLNDALSTATDYTATSDDSGLIVATVAVDPAACDGADAGTNSATCELDITVEDERLTAIEFTDPNGRTRFTFGNKVPAFTLENPADSESAES